MENMIIAEMSRDELVRLIAEKSGKGLYFDYIMANPPFNLKGWYDENLKSDSRWADYERPPESNANYAWILHILSHMKPLKGVAGFLLANGALGDSDTLAIRERLIRDDKVEAIIILPRELFITTDISVTLWILNQNKKGGDYHGRKLRNRKDEILLMDLRTWTENPVKGESKKKVIRHFVQILLVDIPQKFSVLSFNCNQFHFSYPQILTCRNLPSRPKN